MFLDSLPYKIFILLYIFAPIVIVLADYTGTYADSYFISIDQVFNVFYLYDYCLRGYVAFDMSDGPIMAIRQQFEDGYTEICVVTVIVVSFFININALTNGAYFYSNEASPSRNIGLVQVTHPINPFCQHTLSLHAYRPTSFLLPFSYYLCLLFIVVLSFFASSCCCLVVAFAVAEHWVGSVLHHCADLSRGHFLPESSDSD